MVQQKTVFSLGKIYPITPVIPKVGSIEGLCSVSYFWSCFLEGRNVPRGKFSLTVLCMEKSESLVRISGVTFRAQLTCTLPASKGISQTQQCQQSEQTKGLWLLCIPDQGQELASIPHLAQQRFVLAPVIVQCKMVFKNKFGTSHQPSSPMLGTMVMETVTGMESSTAEKEHHRDLLMQK